MGYQAHQSAKLNKKNKSHKQIAFLPLLLLPTTPFILPSGEMCIYSVFKSGRYYLILMTSSMVAGHLR